MSVNEPEKGPLNKYREMVSSGEIEADGMQRLVVEKLQLLAHKLGQAKRSGAANYLSFFRNRRNVTPLKGLYIYGGVGRGKTMLMDLFFETISFEPRRRVHFHEFMVEVHGLIAEARKSHEGDPIPLVSKNLARDAKLLCFDELHVTDITDATILGRLFEHLFAEGVLIVSTSNAAPCELYKNGLNRDLFLPAIEHLKRNMDVMELEAAKDFRLEKLLGQELYFTPAGPEARRSLDTIWRSLTGVAHGAEACLPLKGRHLLVKEAGLGVARFNFADLCDAPLGTDDYLRVARAFHTVLIDDIPVMGPDKRDVARRFINLIDSFYDNRVRLVAGAEAEPSALYVSGDNADLFERTASRLMEMRSEAYIAGDIDRAA